MSKDDQEIPDFLKRKETDEQAAARRAKYAKKDPSGGLKVKKLPEPPPPAVAKAIAKDLKETKAQSDAIVADALAKRDKAIEPKLKKVLKVVISKTQKQESKPLNMINDAMLDNTKRKKGLRKGPKASTLVEKALKARDELAAKAKAVTISKPPTAKPKKSDGKIHRYDWAAAEENAKKGVVPQAPDMSAWTHRYFRNVLADTEKLVKAKKLKELKALRFKRDTGSPGMVKRYRDLAVIALQVK